MTNKSVKLSESNNNAIQNRINQNVPYSYYPKDTHILSKLLAKLGVEFNEPIVWYMVFYFSFFHIISLYGLFFGLDSPTAHLRTILWGERLYAHCTT
jgi:hypothetical protein